jgi:hypothetical protein
MVNIALTAFFHRLDCILAEHINQFSKRGSIVIKSFRSKALKSFYDKGDSSGLNPQWINRIRSAMAQLDVPKSRLTWTCQD